MSNYIYTGKPVAMPNSKSIDDWKDFFNGLMEMDYHAPLHTVINHCKFLYDLDVTVPPTPYASLYYDVGIAMAVDGEDPAYDAADESGFLAKGVCHLIRANSSSDEFGDCYRKVINIVVSHMTDIVEKLPYALYLEAYKLVGSYYFANHPDLGDELAWEVVFQYALISDPFAAASILDYFLEEENGSYSRIFCPLDFEEYKAVGAAMRTSPAVLRAAINSGLMASAITTYIGAALDVVENWDCAVGGVKYLLNSEDLQCFIPINDKYVVRHLLNEFSSPTANEEEEERWLKLNRQLHESIAEGTPRGY